MIYTTRVISAMLTTLFLSCGVLMIAVGLAHADTPQGGLVGNATFKHTVDVRDASAAGFGCTMFGFCDSVTPGSIRDGTVIHHGEHDEPVIVDCTIGQGSLYWVTLDRDGDSTFNGLVPVGSVDVNRTTRVRPC